MFKTRSGIMGATEPNQKVTKDNIVELPLGSVVRLGDNGRLIHLHDDLWLYCTDNSWCYDKIKYLLNRLDKDAVLCHIL